MTYTEEGAREQFCPVLAAAALVAKLEAGKGYGRCVASKCMWWRWHDNPNGPCPSSVTQEEWRATSLGYCGAAGKVE